MSTYPRIEHNGKTYELASKKISAALLDDIEPILNAIRSDSQVQELMDIVVSDPDVFRIIDPTTTDLREGIAQDELVNLMRRNPRLFKALRIPTVKIKTSKSSRTAGMQILQKTVDTSRMPEDLRANIMSNCVPPSIKAEGEEQDPPVSEFWNEFDLEILIEYVEGFCKRVRI